MHSLPLYDQHVLLDAQMAEFGGLLVPLQYSSILEEHLATRHAVGLFDISHNMRIFLRGKHAFLLLQSLSATDMSPLQSDFACQAILCRPDGGVLSAFAVYPLENGYLCTLGPLSAYQTIDYLQAELALLPPDKQEVTFVDRSAEFVQLSLYGPDAKELLHRFKASSALIYSKPDYCGKYLLDGVPVFASLSYFLREKGFELFVPRISGVDVWTRLLALGANPCGLPALEVLRVESARPAYGHELTDQINPLEANLGDEIAFDKGEFPGRDSLLQYKKSPKRRLIGLHSDIKGVFQKDQIVFLNDVPCGIVTSGSTSPSTSGSVAMALVPLLLDASQNLSVVYRNKHRTARMVSLPFYTNSN